ncbi:RtcB family protein [Candidatus Pacearchaeota archaeon]|jgi:tRNA-splicing ligase RtcB|nr:RtcB family protein [Candidatus Pacearchaeota archaeon]
MEWVQTIGCKIPIKSWCSPLEQGAMSQAIALANHPVVVRHVALMPDCHEGYGMPIGGVIACKNAVIPNAVGKDISCGMRAVETNIPADILDKETIQEILHSTKRDIPVGFSVHSEKQEWITFVNEGIRHNMFTVIFNNNRAGWNEGYKTQDRAEKSLGTLGGGNHFIELQKSDDGFVWLMVHSGSRNLGAVIADYYNKKALELNRKWQAAIPNKDLAFLPVDDDAGKEYIKHMKWCMEFAEENRKRLMEKFKIALEHTFNKKGFFHSYEREIDINHNFAQLENHFGQNLWIHRKGATQARLGQIGIIPGSMGTPSYIVEGLGNKDSFESCSHGAGRRMARSKASDTLTIEECNEAMKDIVYEGWGKTEKRKNREQKIDLSEAPQAYKDIDLVMEAQKDLVKPLVKLYPLGVIKG